MQLILTKFVCACTIRIENSIYIVDTFDIHSQFDLDFVLKYEISCFFDNYFPLVKSFPTNFMKYLVLKIAFNSYLCVKLPNLMIFCCMPIDDEHPLFAIFSVDHSIFAIFSVEHPIFAIFNCQSVKLFPFSFSVFSACVSVFSI